MRLGLERRLLQAAVALACLAPLAMGSLSVIRGVATIKGAGVTPDLDSHFRYLSGIFLMLGVAFASCIPAIERRGSRFRLLGAMVIAGGLARLLSWAMIGTPGFGHRFGLAMELGVVPLLMLWQARVERRALAAPKMKKDRRGPRPGDPSTWSAAGGTGPGDPGGF